ncbi:MAG: hypothetical protein JNJ83_01360 [Verrucomicrobiaceae bacterium]|nr:hypothetical protein [Verrucomicrobiaceae bacterium]
MRYRTPTTVMLACTLQAAVAWAAGWGVQVVDETSGRGIPMVVLSANNGATWVTDNAGWACVDEPDLQGQPIYLTAVSPGYVYPKDSAGFSGTEVKVEAGGTVVLKMMRTDLAERMARLTGTGLYRDSKALGKDIAIAAHTPPPLARQSNALTELHRGEVCWLWQEAEQMTHPGQRLAVTGTKSRLASPPSALAMEQWSPTPAPQTLLPVPGAPWVVVDGLVSVPDADGNARLVAHYIIQGKDTAKVEHGLAELNEEGLFDRIVVLGDEYQWQLPAGGAVKVKEHEQEWLYFARPFCTVRVPATFEAIRTPSFYQALTWDADAKDYRWQTERGPMEPSNEVELLAGGMVSANQARFRLLEAVSGTAVPVATGSVQWNEFRQRWVMIASAALDEVWYAESVKPEGPWGKAVRIVTLAGMDYRKVCQRPFLTEEKGRVIYFDGAVSGSGLPRYEGCQLMYRLDLSDARLGAAQRW